MAPLTGAQQDAVTTTWASGIAGKEEAVGKDMFVKLFAKHSEVMGDFGFATADEAQMKTHGKKVIDGLGKIVAAAGSPDAVITTIGKTHKTRQLNPKDALFAPLGEALIGALKDHIGGGWNGDVEAAYLALYAHLQTVMMKAAT